MLQKTWLAMAMAAAFTLTGCGGGGGGGDTTPTTPEKTEYQITAIDGYLEKAYVWLDCDNDGVRDSDEAQGLTNASGVAVVDVTEVESPESCPIGVYAKAGFTLDADDNGAKIATDYTLWAPAGSVSSKKAVVTPLSTLVLFQVQQGSTPNVAKAEVAALLGVEQSQLSSDFIAANQHAAGAIAANLVQVLPKLDMHGKGGWGGTQAENVVSEVASAVRAEYSKQSTATGENRRKGIRVSVDSAGNVGEAIYTPPGGTGGPECPTGQVPVNGVCVDKPVDPVCSDTEELVGDVCVAKCATGEVRDNTGKCVVDSVECEIE